DALHVLVVRDQRDATRPDPARSHEVEPSPDHGAESIGPDDVASAAHARLAVGSNRAHTGYSRRTVSRDVGDANTFLDAGAGVARPPENDLVQYRSSNRQTLVAESAEAVVCGELSICDNAVRRADAHAG